MKTSIFLILNFFFIIAFNPLKGQQVEVDMKNMWLSDDQVLKIYRNLLLNKRYSEGSIPNTLDCKDLPSSIFDFYASSSEKTRRHGGILRHEPRPTDEKLKEDIKSGKFYLSPWSPSLVHPLNFWTEKKMENFDTSEEELPVVPLLSITEEDTQKLVIYELHYDLHNAIHFKGHVAVGIEKGGIIAVFNGPYDFFSKIQHDAKEIMQLLRKKTRTIPEGLKKAMFEPIDRENRISNFVFSTVLPFVKRAKKIPRQHSPEDFMAAWFYTELIYSNIIPFDENVRMEYMGWQKGYYLFRVNVDYAESPPIGREYKAPTYLTLNFSEAQLSAQKMFFRANMRCGFSLNNLPSMVTFKVNPESGSVLFDDIKVSSYLSSLPKNIGIGHQD